MFKKRRHEEAMHRQAFYAWMEADRVMNLLATVRQTPTRVTLISWRDGTVSCKCPWHHWNALYTRYFANGAKQSKELDNTIRAQHQIDVARRVISEAVESGTPEALMRPLERPAKRKRTRLKKPGPDDAAQPLLPKVTQTLADIAATAPPAVEAVNTPPREEHPGADGIGEETTEATPEKDTALNETEGSTPDPQPPAGNTLKTDAENLQHALVEYTETLKTGNVKAKVLTAWWRYIVSVVNTSIAIEQTAIRAAGGNMETVKAAHKLSPFRPRNIQQLTAFLRFIFGEMDSMQELDDLHKLQTAMQNYLATYNSAQNRGVEQPPTPLVNFTIEVVPSREPPPTPVPA